MAALLASGIGVGVEASTPLLTRLAVNDAVAGTTERLGWLVAALAAVALLQFGTAFVRRYLGGRLSLDVQHDLRNAVFRAVQRRDGAKQDSLHTGQIVSRAISDLQLVQGLLSMVPLTAGVLVLFAVALAAMLWLSPLLTPDCADRGAGRRAGHHPDAGGCCFRRPGRLSSGRPRSPSMSRRPSPECGW